MIVIVIIQLLVIIALCFKDDILTLLKDKKT